MPGCSADGCTNSSTKGFQMCRIPWDSQRKALWLHHVNKPNWIPGPNCMLCEVHFEDEMWEKTREGKRRLKRTAYPTLFEVHQYKQKKIKNRSNTNNNLQTRVQTSQQHIQKSLLGKAWNNQNYFASAIITGDDASNNLNDFSDLIIVPDESIKMDQLIELDEVTLAAQKVLYRNIDAEKESSPNVFLLKMDNNFSNESNLDDKVQKNDHNYAKSTSEDKQFSDKVGNSLDSENIQNNINVRFKEESYKTSSLSKDNEILLIKDRLAKLEKLYDISERSRILFKRKLDAARQKIYRLEKLLKLKNSELTIDNMFKNDELLLLNKSYKKTSKESEKFSKETKT